jgi:hypothetical protein
VGKKARVRAKQYGGPVFSTDAPAAEEESDELEEGDDAAEAMEPAAEAELEPGDDTDGELAAAAADEGPVIDAVGDEPASEEDGEKAS